MADGEINRNGATIRIDDDGGVQVEPAEGQEVEYTGPDRGTDAIRDSVNTDSAKIERTINSSLEQNLSDPEDLMDMNGDFGLGLVRTVERQVDGDNVSVALIGDGTSSWPNSRPNGFVIVSGQRVGDANVGFTDLVIITQFSSVEVVSSNTRGNVGARSYSSGGDIAIDESGEAYNVIAVFIGGDLGGL